MSYVKTVRRDRDAFALSIGSPEVSRGESIRSSHPTASLAQHPPYLCLCSQKHQMSLSSLLRSLCLQSSRKTLHAFRDALCEPQKAIIAVSMPALCETERSYTSFDAASTQKTYMKSLALLLFNCNNCHLLNVHQKLPSPSCMSALASLSASKNARQRINDQRLQASKVFSKHVRLPCNHSSCCI